MIAKTLNKIYHAYPFFFTSLMGFLVLGIGWDSWPLSAHFYKLLEEEKNLAQQLEEKQSAWQQAGPVAGQWLHQPLAKMPQPLLDQIRLALESQAILLNTLETEFKVRENKTANTDKSSPAPPTEYQALVIKLNLNAHFFQLEQFLEKLWQQGLPLRLDRLSLKKQNDILEVFLQFSAFPWIVARNSHHQPRVERIFKALKLRDPFQESERFPPESLLLEDPALENLLRAYQMRVSRSLRGR